MTNVILTGTIRIPVEDLEHVCAELPSHIERTRAEPGCLKFEVNVDEEDPTLFHVSEVFRDAQSFADHQARVRASKWGSITKDAARNYAVEGLPH